MSSTVPTPEARDFAEPVPEVAEGVLVRGATPAAASGPEHVTEPVAYDAILLDVDNGPEGLTRESNDSLYDLPGLSAARTALTPGGVLAVWSSAPNKAFTQRLRKVGFRVDEVGARATGTGRGARHTIWIAARQGGSPSAPA